MKRSKERSVEVRLTPDEALVLFEWLHRLQDEGALNELPGLLRGERAAL